MKRLKFNKWYDIKEYYKRVDQMDWALVQFKETKTGFRPLPKVAEYNKKDKVWMTHSEWDRYLCEMCEAEAFMLWKPYDKTDRKLVKRALRNKKVKPIFINLNGKYLDPK